MSKSESAANEEERDGRRLNNRDAGVVRVSNQAVVKQRLVRQGALEAQLMRLLGQTMEHTSWAGCRHTGMWLGLAFFYGVRGRREVAVNNVRLAFPQLSEAGAARIARRAAQNFGMTFCEFLHLRTASAQEIRDYCEFDGLEHIREGFAQGCGVLLLTAHLGNWEVMGARVAQEFPLSVVARPASNSGVQRHIDGVRRAVGMNVISKFDTGRASMNALRANHLLAILPDQYVWPDGTLLPMFGQPTRVVTGLPRLALLSGAPMVPAFGMRRAPWLRDGRIVIRVSEGMHLKQEAGSRQKNRDPAAREAAVIQGTRRMIGELEKIISRYPDQWLWMHRRWRREDGATIPITKANHHRHGR